MYIEECKIERTYNIGNTLLNIKFLQFFTILRFEVTQYLPSILRSTRMYCRKIIFSVQLSESVLVLINLVCLYIFCLVCFDVHFRHDCSQTQGYIYKKN